MPVEASSDGDGPATPETLARLSGLEAKVRTLKKESTQGHEATDKGKARAANYDSSDLDDDDDNAAAAGEAGAYRKVSDDDDDDSDDDLAVVGVKGQFALRDFPHTREHCAAKKATFGTEDHCSNCYCMVCDCVVAKCSDWKLHCKAIYSDPKWRQARERAKSGGAGTAGGSSGGGGGGGAAALSSRAFQMPGRVGLDDVPFNCAALLKAVQQVYPDEVKKPSGLIVSALRHYQKQSIAFMLANEKATTVAGQTADPRIGRLTRTATMSYESAPMTSWGWKPSMQEDGLIRGGWLCDEVGMGKTICCIAAILANPCTDATTDFTAFNEWKAKDKLLAIPGNKATADLKEAKENERIFNRHKQVPRSAEEIRLSERLNAWQGSAYVVPTHKEVLDPSKTAAYKTLVAKTQSARTASDQAYKTYTEKLQKLGARPTTKHKATVIVVPPTLLGQWLDEIKKFAPSLKVYSAHAGTGGKDFKKFRQSEAVARAADVILVSSGLCSSIEVGKDKYLGNTPCIGGDDQVQFHRVIVDEVHLRDPRKKWSIAPLRWGVTGTPASKSPSDLVAMASWLGQTSLARTLKTDSRRSVVHKDTLASHVKHLKSLMIRHTKAMHIGGETALVLPTLQTKSIMLEMSAAERRLYSSERERNLLQRQIIHARSWGATMMHLDMHLKASRDAANGLEPTGTKMKALKKSLVDLKATEPHFQVIIFTRTASAHANIVCMAKALGVATYELSANVDMKKRHASIRQFQTPAKTPRVCVASINIGSVGVTLTAATRVYLMEPSIDPAAEVQCAGRIHRLGQTKDVLFTRFCFRNTIDEATVKLHEKFAKNELTIDDNRKLSAEGVKLITSM